MLGEKLFPSLEDLDRLKYLRASMMESQRRHMLHQTVTRTLTEDVVVSGYTIPANTKMVLHLNEVCQSILSRELPNPLHGALTLGFMLTLTPPSFAQALSFQTSHTATPNPTPHVLSPPSALALTLTAATIIPVFIICK